MMTSQTLGLKNFTLGEFCVLANVILLLLVCVQTNGFDM